MTQKEALATLKHYKKTVKSKDFEDALVVAIRVLGKSIGYWDKQNQKKQRRVEKENYALDRKFDRMVRE